MSRKQSRNAPESLTLKPSELRIAITSIIKAVQSGNPVSPFIWGPPGIGKSQIIRQVAEDFGYKFVDIRLSQMDPTDLRGIPYPDNVSTPKDLVNDVVSSMDHLFSAVEQEDGGADSERQNMIIQAALTAVADNAGRKVLKFSPPNFYQPDPNVKTLYLFDEMNAAPQSIQAAAYQIILDRKIGDYFLGPNDVVIAAGNRETDKGATFKMPTPLMNRFTHLEMRTDFEDWQEHAILNGFHKVVVGYLSWMKHELFQFDPTSASRGFPTPRSWEFVSNIMKGNPDLPEMVMLCLVAGAVGDGAAIKFLEYRKLNEKLPNPSDILTGKIKTLTDDQKEISIMYSLTIGLCYELRESYDEAMIAKKAGQSTEHDEWIKKADRFFGFMLSEFQPEMAVLGARTILSNFKIRIVPPKMPEWKKFSQRYNKLILDN